MLFYYSMSKITEAVAGLAGIDLVLEARSREGRQPALEALLPEGSEPGVTRVGQRVQWPVVLVEAVHLCEVEYIYE